MAFSDDFRLTKGSAIERPEGGDSEPFAARRPVASPPPPPPPPPPSPPAASQPLIPPPPVSAPQSRQPMPTAPPAARQPAAAAPAMEKPKLTATPLSPNTKSSGETELPKSSSAALPTTTRGGFRWWPGRRRPPATTAEQLAQQQQERRQLPSWLVSFVVHLALLLILALIPIQNLVRGPLTLLLGEAVDSGETEFELAGLETSEVVSELEFNETNAVESTIDPTEQLRELDLPDLRPAEPTISTPELAIQNIPFGIKNGLTGRSGALKEALLAKFGGTAETEEAVELGLRWLAKQQKSNGSWSLIGPYSKGGSSENTTAATAMAINAFLGAGYTHKQGKYAENVKLGLAYLVRRQNSEGFFSTREPSRQQMYAQALASIAVTEAYGMSQDEELRIAAQKAIGFAEWSQSDLRGWRYEPRREADLSVTGWFVMALETGKMAGLAVDEDKLQGVNYFLDNVSHEQDSRYAYTDYEPPSLSMTAEGLLCRIYLGWPRSHPALLAAIHDDLLPNKPRKDEREYSVYYWYYATQVLHHVGGGVWDEWNEAMRKVLPAMQVKKGDEVGSWDPSKDMFGASGGRLYTTCLNLYCLEVYYRHLSLYDLR